MRARFGWTPPVDPRRGGGRGHSIAICVARTIAPTGDDGGQDDGPLPLGMVVLAGRGGGGHPNCGPVRGWDALRS